MGQDSWEPLSPDALTEIVNRHCLKHCICSPEEHDRVLASALRYYERGIHTKAGMIEALEDEDLILRANSI